MASESSIPPPPPPPPFVCTRCFTIFDRRTLWENHKHLCISEPDTIRRVSSTITHTGETVSGCFITGIVHHIFFWYARVFQLYGGLDKFSAAEFNGVFGHKRPFNTVAKKLEVFDWVLEKYGRRRCGAPLEGGQRAGYPCLRLLSCNFPGHGTVGYEQLQQQQQQHACAAHHAELAAAAAEAAAAAANEDADAGEFGTEAATASASTPVAFNGPKLSPADQAIIDLFDKLKF